MSSTIDRFTDTVLPLARRREELRFKKRVSKKDKRLKHSSTIELREVSDLEPLTPDLEFFLERNCKTYGLQPYVKRPYGLNCSYSCYSNSRWSGTLEGIMNCQCGMGD